MTQGHTIGDSGALTPCLRCPLPWHNSGPLIHFAWIIAITSKACLCLQSISMVPPPPHHQGNLCKAEAWSCLPENPSETLYHPEQRWCPQSLQKAEGEMSARTMDRQWGAVGIVVNRSMAIERHSNSQFYKILCETNKAFSDTGCNLGLPVCESRPRAWSPSPLAWFTRFSCPVAKPCLTYKSYDYQTACSSSAHAMLVLSSDPRITSPTLYLAKSCSPL